jgi:hypothetical protein
VENKFLKCIKRKVNNLRKRKKEQDMEQIVIIILNGQLANGYKIEN